MAYPTWPNSLNAKQSAGDTGSRKLKLGSLPEWNCVVLTKAQRHEKEAKPLISNDTEEIEVWAGSTTA